MANISQNVNIEMLEKLPDGTYKRKYPKTRADDGTTFDEHLADDASQAHLAKNIGLEDTAGNFTATEVEGAMNELFTNVSSGKDLVGGAITDVDDSVVIPTEPTFQELANAISGISTGKKWASGVLATNTVAGLDFTPSLVVIYTTENSGSYEGFFQIILSEAKIIFCNSPRNAVHGARTAGQTASWSNSSITGNTFTSSSISNWYLNRSSWIAFE